MNSTLEPQKNLVEMLQEAGPDFSMEITDAYKTIMKFYCTQNPHGMQELFQAYINWQARTSDEDVESLVDKAYYVFDEVCTAIDIFNTSLKYAVKYNGPKDKRLLTDEASFRARFISPYATGQVKSFYRNALEFHPKIPEMNIQNNRHTKYELVNLKDILFITQSDSQMPKDDVD